jgi:protein-disulfide isomerase
MSLIQRLTVAAMVCGLAASNVYGQVASAPPQPKAAEVNGFVIGANDLDAKLGNNLAKLQEEIFTLRQKALDAMIEQRLLEEEAARRQVAVPVLVETEITSKVKPVTAEDVASFYQENKGRLQGELTTYQDQIRTYLTTQRLQSQRQNYLKSLRAAAKVTVYLTPPPIYRSAVATVGAPVRGAAMAPVTIVEFSDFHCPYCRSVQPVLTQVLQKYGDKVKLVFRDYPIDVLHPQARAVAEAARCATEQGKFWEFHDLVFKGSPDATGAVLDGYAKDLGLDTATFTSCRTARKYKAAVTSSNDEGAELGITGTPTFFVNGRMLVGALPLESFSKIIDEELAAVAKNAPVTPSKDEARFR